MKNQAHRVPMFFQIRNYITDQIKQNLWKPGDRIPSENEFCSLFNVSRITVKKAMDDLIKEGLVFRVQGKGTFISKDTKGEPILYSSISSTKKDDLPIIAFLMPRLDSLHNAYLLNGIESEVSRNGYKLLFCKTNDSQTKEKQLLRDLTKMGVKGIIIFPVDGEVFNEEILQLAINNYPLVLIDRYLRGIETNCVYSNNVEAAYNAVSYLINLGHTKIGLVSTEMQGTTSIEDRITGYERALADHNIPIEHRLRLTHFQTEKMNEILTNGVTNEDYKKDLMKFLSNNPDMTAVFGINSSIGLTIMDSAMDLGLHIPEDLSVLFFDYELTPLVPISPTCVSQEEKKMGQESAKLLLSIIENPNLERKKIILSPKLIIRDSTGPCSANRVQISLADV